MFVIKMKSLLNFSNKHRFCRSEREEGRDEDWSREWRRGSVLYKIDADTIQDGGRKGGLYESGSYMIHVGWRSGGFYESDYCMIQDDFNYVGL